MAIPDDLIGTAEVARLAGITVAAVRKALERGTMPEPTRILGRLAWRRGDVEEWLSTRRGPFGRPL